MEILLARTEHLAAVSQLFDQYRIFYQQPTDLVAAQTFIGERLQKGDSKILVAIKEDQSIGFVQLYPSFSSVSMQPIWILNDLFVAESDRQQGVAKSLIRAAADFAKGTGAIRVTLSTQISNVTAQSLYESLGFSKDQDFYHYDLAL